MYHRLRLILPCIIMACAAGCARQQVRKLYLSNARLTRGSEIAVDGHATGMEWAGGAAVPLGDGGVAWFAYDNKALYGLLTKHEVAGFFSRGNFYEQKHPEYSIRITAKRRGVWLHFRFRPGKDGEPPALELADATGGNPARLGLGGDPLYQEEAFEVATSTPTDKGFRWTTEFRLSWDAVRISSLRKSQVVVVLYRLSRTRSFFSRKPKLKWDMIKTYLHKRTRQE